MGVFRATVALVALGCLGVLAFLPQLVTEGQFYSLAGREWTVRVAPEGDQPWRLGLPTLVAANGSQEAMLAAFVGRLRVVDGIATLEMTERELRLEGRGPAVVRAAHREWAMLDGPVWGDWVASRGDVARSDDAPGDVDVEWHVRFTGGGGHVCMADDVWGARVGPGSNATLVLRSEYAGPALAAGGSPIRLACA